MEQKFFSIDSITGPCVNNLQGIKKVQAGLHSSGLGVIGGKVEKRWDDEMGKAQKLGEKRYIIGNKLLIDKDFVEMSSIWQQLYLGTRGKMKVEEKVYITGCIGEILRLKFGLQIGEVYMALMNKWDDKAHAFYSRGLQKEMGGINQVLYCDNYKIDWDMLRLGIEHIRGIECKLQGSIRGTSCYLNQLRVGDKVYLGASPKRVVDENFVERRVKKGGKSVDKVTNYYLGELGEEMPELARIVREVEIVF